MRALALLALLSTVGGLVLTPQTGVRPRAAPPTASRLTMRHADPLPSRAAALAYLAAPGLMAVHVDAAVAETGAGMPVDDNLLVGFAFVLVVATGLLQLSLGDIQAEEAQLPSSVSLINKNRQKTNSFIKTKKPR